MVVLKKVQLHGDVYEQL